MKVIVGDGFVSFVLCQIARTLLGLNFLLAHVSVLISFGQVGFLLTIFLCDWRNDLDLLDQLCRRLLRLAL